MSEEYFQTFSSSGAPLGLVARAEVHARGLWHKAVQVLLYRSSGELLLQQRAATKDLHPNHWDSSVGEHLKPGESYAEAAHRGLREELSVEVKSISLLGEEQRLQLAGDGFRDCEMQLAYRATYDGLIQFNDEVQAVRWVNKCELVAMLEDKRYPFTPWFHQHLQTYNLLNSLS